MASQRQIQSSDQKTEQVSIPPHSTEAEQAVLGGIMLSNQHWDGIAERVIAEDFYTFAHKAIFQTMEELMRNQTPIDLITLDQALKAKGISDSVGGFAYLADLSNNTPNAINILAYAEIVREKAILRELIAVGNRIAETVIPQKAKTSKWCWMKLKGKYLRSLKNGVLQQRDLKTCSAYWKVLLLELKP